MNMRAVFSVALPPVAPAKATTPSTAGSRSTMAARRCWIADMAAKEMSCRASAWAKMKPVSCCGKKPLGMMT